MPFPINPNDYNIDKLSTGFLGDISSTDFRNYLFAKNLPELPEELSSLQSFYEEKGLDKTINYTTLVNPGDIEKWLISNGNYQTVFDISYNNPKQNMGANQYGPSTIQEYNEPSLIPKETSYVGYPTSTGGGSADFFKDQLLNQSLNLGPGSAINFDSELNEIAKERRKEELLNRLRINGQNETIGKLNLDPFGLLMGQDLLLKDYDITVRSGLIGKVVDFASDSVGLQLPVSTIPDGAFGKYGDLDDPQSYEDLMKSTGSGTKSLIFKSLSYNKYGPTVQEPTGLLSNLFGAGQSPQNKKYTDNVDGEFEADEQENKDKPFIDRVNQAIGKIVDNVAKSVGIGTDNLEPTEFSNPTIEPDNISQNSSFGFDTLSFNYDNSVTNFTHDPIGTKLPGEASDGAPLPYDDSMYWSYRKTNPFKRGLLKHTQNLINNSKNINNSKSRYIGNINDKDNFIEKNKKQHHKDYSMGNTVRSKDDFYCRSWSVRKPYRLVNDLIRHGGGSGDTRTSLTRNDSGLSVLGSNGFVKVAPYITKDKNGLKRLDRGDVRIQKYMLSIENLAWQNSAQLKDLIPCEVGPNGGRIMWFPPYDISFTDNSSVNWDSTNFIGRGEPIYTYNNTERIGSLSFKIVVDHSLGLSELREEAKKEGSDDVLFRYFAGCLDPLEAALSIIPASVVESVKTENKVEDTKKTEDTVKVEEPVDQNNPTNYTGKLPEFYFRNARTFDKDSIGTTLTTELSPNADEKPPNYMTPKGHYRAWPQGYYISGGTTLNKNGDAITNLDEVIKFLLSSNGKRYKIIVNAYTSKSGSKANNTKLAQKRAETTKDYILQKLKEEESKMGEIYVEAYLNSKETYPKEELLSSDKSYGRWELKSNGETGASDKENDQPASPRSIDSRVTKITLEYNPTMDEKVAKKITENNTKTEDAKKVETKEDTKIAKEENKFSRGVQELPTVNASPQKSDLLGKLTELGRRYLAWECTYFHEMEQDTPFIYDTLKEKIKYFHPAFHSMTPEGFNARLTFLKQCTRQGPTISSNEPSNLAFGKPPVCVLRVGDFYHTKIIIDSVNLTFDPLLWDLNPEGIGVQPMLCSVDLGFKFIGGSSLGGPISQLQNAVAFNFFANTSLYEAKSILDSKSVETNSTIKTKPSDKDTPPVVGDGGTSKKSQISPEEQKLIDDANKPTETKTEGKKEGFDKKTGQYRTQKKQILKIYDNGGQQIYSKEFLIEKDTLIYPKDGKLVISVAKTKDSNINPSVIKDKKISVFCKENKFIYNDTINGAKYYNEYDNDILMNRLKEIYCNGDKLKTWDELTK